MTHRTRRAERSQRDRRDENMRLRDLIPALRAQHTSASALLQRIDPSIADELRAYAAHRRIDLMDFAAECLEQLAAEAADKIWLLGIERHTLITDDPEAALLGGILETAMRSCLQREYRIGSSSNVQTVFIGFSRSGHPYQMA
jgi:hypothetical protein